MGLIDRCTETVVLFPSRGATDEYGNALALAGPQPVMVRANVQATTTEEDSSAGQEAGTTVRVFARRLPVGAFARATWAGRTWDVVGEAVRRRSGSTATHHDVLTLRARTPAAS